MKNQITLSLITAAILGLTGCGEPSKSVETSDDRIKLSSIQKLSEASTKNTKSDWLKLQNYIQDLDNTEKFNTMLLGSIDENIAQLSSVGIDKEEAYVIHANFIYDDLIDLNIEDLDDHIVIECKDNDSCKEEAYRSMSKILIIDKEEAYSIATDVRGEEKSLVNDKLVKEFTCESGDVRTVKHYGLEDVFNLSNGAESTSPNPTTALMPNLVAYNNNVNSSFINYDNTHNDRLFLEDIKNLPAGITKGRFYIGLKSNGSSLQVNDTMSIGDLTATGALNTQARYAAKLTDLSGDGWSNQLVSSTNPTTDIYWNDFANIIFKDGQTLKNYVQTHNRFDAYVQDDTSVDFITVATCSKKDSIKEVSTIVNKFECSEKETMLKILGGTLDAFNPTADTAAEPSSNLESIALGNTVYPTVADYDHTAYDYHFVETLNLPLSSSQTVTKAELNLGYKVIGSSLYSNDRTYLGDINGSAGNYIGANLYGTTTLNRQTIPSYGYLVKEDLLTLSNNSAQSTGTVGATMISKGKLDIYVQDDTAVDFTQLNLCVTDNCSEGAQNIELNLSQLSAWTFKPSDASENNVFNGTQYQGVWDDTLNWFDFNNTHTDELLEIPFCACGDTVINIANLKADNSATIKLDTTLIASQTANGQDAMKRDDMGGVHENGNLTVPVGTNGGTNHVLRVNIHNLGSEFGVAIDGTMKFRGNLGKCTE